MSGDRGVIVVGIDSTLGSDVAQRWAIEDARRSGRPVRLVCAYTWTVTLGAAEIYAAEPELGLAALREAAEHTVALALEQARAVADDVAVSGEAVEGAAVEVLLAESESAALLVLGSRQLRTTGSFLLGSVGAAVAARAACPTVVTRGPAAYPADGARVLVGVDGTADSQTVLAFAFDFASRHNSSVHAMLGWHPSVLHRARRRSEAAAQEQQQAATRRQQALAGWRERCPGVLVTSAVVEDHPVAALVAETPEEALIVVGHRRRPILSVIRSGSVSRGVLHHAACPVALVPLGENDEGGADAPA